MFTGIVEGLGKVENVVVENQNKHFELSCPFTHELKVDQSLSHNGVCLTVTRIEGMNYWVTAVAETLLKTNIGLWQPGDMVNLERCMPANGRFDGHIVQGHVDQTGMCTNIKEMGGSWLISFEYEAINGNITVPKGSICVNGVSLTVVDSAPGHFSVAIIPFTWENTNFHLLQPRKSVNLEFDILGKYIRQMLGNYLPIR